MEAALAEEVGAVEEAAVAVAAVAVAEVAEPPERICYSNEQRQNQEARLLSVRTKEGLGLIPSMPASGVLYSVQSRIYLVQSL